MQINKNRFKDAIITDITNVTEVTNAIRQAIIISDIHAGCQFGLFPDKTLLIDGGNQVSQSVLQSKVWVWWNEFWNDWVPRVTKNEKYVIVINGDTTDGRHHGSTTQISQNMSDQSKIAMEILQPILAQPNVAGLYMTRGTEAHTGPSGENEELLAKALGAIPDEIGNYARNELWLRIGGKNGALAHILHHIGTTGRTHYETSAPMAEYGESCLEAGRWSTNAPDFVIRSHRHRYVETVISTSRGYGMSIVTPGWQLKTPFSWKIAGGRNSLPQFGGILIRQGEEEHYSRSFVKNVSRTQEVVI